MSIIDKLIDRIADRVVERLEAQHRNITINNSFGISKGLPGIGEYLTDQVAAMQAPAGHRA